MVIKLIKREISDSSRSFIPVLACILLGSILVPVQLRYMEASLVSAIINFIVVILVFSVFILSIRASFYILYTNLYNRSGYELFTLPVKAWQIIVSKILTLLFWYLVIGVVATLSFILFGIILTGDISLIFEGIGIFMKYVMPEFLNVDALLVLANSLSSTLQACILVFFVGAIANSSFFSRNRAWFALLFFLLISWGVNMVVAGLGIDFVGISFVGSMDGIQMEFNRMVLLGGLVFNLVLTGFYFLGTLWFWDNKLEIMN